MSTKQEASTAPVDANAKSDNLPKARTYVIDLHGYTITEAEVIADTIVRETWENGYDFITLIHGSPFIDHHVQARHLGRGGIKWMLRGALSRGGWKAYVYNRRSKKHQIDLGSMTLALKPNPNPNEPEKWSEFPEGLYR